MKSRTNAMDEREIIELYWQRDERAIKETDRAFRAQLLSVARSLLRDAQDAEECLNDTYVRVWNSIPPAHPDSLKAYVLSIVRKTAISKYKASRRQKRVPAEMISSLSELGDMLSDGDSFHTEQQAQALGGILTSILHGLGKAFPAFCFNTCALVLRLCFVLFLIPRIGMFGYLLGIFVSELALIVMMLSALSCYLRPCKFDAHKL